MDIRESLKASSEIDIYIIETASDAGNGKELRNIFETHPHEKLKIRRLDYQTFEEAADKNSLKSIPNVKPDIIFLSIASPGDTYIVDFIKSVVDHFSKIPVIAVINHEEMENLFSILKLGVADIIIPPLRRTDLLLRVQRLIEQRSSEEILVSGLKEKLGLQQQFVGASPLFRAETNKIPIIAACDSSVLILGETGTGKELCARAVHYLSPRASKPFLPVNCGAIPHDLIENELFGHARGAFTGAASHEGLVYEANGGTLFLDEVDCLPLSAQAKLLRFVQEKEYRRLGSAKTHKANVRIIAATNRDLLKAVHAGSFREDLYYRLSGIELCLPPLRKRTEDIPLLVHHFMAEHAEEVGTSMPEISPAAIHRLNQYSWPGNVRELKNVINRTLIFRNGGAISENDIILPKKDAVHVPKSFREEKARIVAEFEKKYLNSLLNAHQGNITQAAKAAKKNRRAFWELMRKHNIAATSENEHTC